MISEQMLMTSSMESPCGVVDASSPCFAMPSPERPGDTAHKAVRRELQHAHIPPPEAISPASFIAVVMPRSNISIFFVISLKKGVDKSADIVYDIKCRREKPADTHDAG